MAQQLAEIQLDTALITLDAFAAEGRTFSQKTYERLDRLRELRTQVGYVPADQDVAGAVERALQLQSPGAKGAGTRHIVGELRTTHRSRWMR